MVASYVISKKCPQNPTVWGPLGFFLGIARPTSEFKSSAPEMVSQGKARSTSKGEIILEENSDPRTFQGPRK